MSLSLEKKEFIIEFDREIQIHLSKKATDEKILVSMIDEMPIIKSIINSTSR